MMHWSYVFLGLTHPYVLADLNVSTHAMQYLYQTQG